MYGIQATMIRVQSCVRCWEQVLQVRAELLCKQQACQQAAGLPERLSSGCAATSSSSIVQARLWAASLAGSVCVLKSVHWSEKDELQAEGNQGCVHAAQGRHNLAAHSFAAAYRLASQAQEVSRKALHEGAA